MAATAAATVFSTSSNQSFADGSWYNPFSYSRSPSENDSKSDDKSSPTPANTSSDEESSGRSSGFDPEALERAAKALREINNSPLSKDVGISLTEINLGIFRDFFFLLNILSD